jgi:hypothetical protein
MNKERNIGHFGDESKITEKKIVVSTRTPEDMTINVLGEFAESRKKLPLASSCLPVSLHACVKHQASQWADFVMFYTGKFHYNSVEKTEIRLISDKNIRQFTAFLYCYLEEHR